MNLEQSKKAQIGTIAFLLILGIFINFSFAQQEKKLEEPIRERISFKGKALKFWEEKIVPIFKDMVEWERGAKHRFEREIEERKLILSEELKKEKEELKIDLENIGFYFEKTTNFFKDIKEKIFKNIYSLMNK